MRKILWTGLLLILTCPAYANTANPVDKNLRALLIKAVNESDSFVDRYDAEVWLVDMSRRLAKKVPEPQKRLQLLK